MNIDVVRDIYIGMSEQLGKNLDIHALVIAVCSESMPKNMFASVLNPCIAAYALRLPSQSLVRKPFAVVSHEYPLFDCRARAERRKTAFGVSGIVRLLDSLFAQS
jgi:hypothetical protein